MDPDIDIIGRSPLLVNVLKKAEAFAPVPRPLIIRGERGTGKELLAQYIHRKSRFRGGPFIAVNCAVFNDELLNSELFGHEKGAFTGATSQRRGCLEKAKAGTLFFDEVGNMSMLVREIPNFEPRHFSAGSIRQMMHYYWPGNIRELKNVVERLLLHPGNDTVLTSDLPLEITAAAPAGKNFNEKVEDIVQRQVEAISNLKIDKITVWDSAGGDGRGSSTANFVSSMIKSVPPLQDIASMAGVELPSYLGKVAEGPMPAPASSSAEKPSPPAKKQSPKGEGSQSSNE